MTKLTPINITKFAQKAVILKYQIDELGGTFAVESAKRQGTKVKVKVPVGG